MRRLRLGRVTRTDFGRSVRVIPAVLVLTLAPLVAGDELRPEAVAFFETRIRPLLVEHCYECHSATSETVHGGLVLDSRPGIQKGGDSGEVIIPGVPDRSLLVHAVRYDDELLQMPPEGMLSAAQIRDLVSWVAMGAPDPRSVGTLVESHALDVAAADEHWAFRPPEDVLVPAIHDTTWPQSPIDHFILAGLEAKGLHPAPPADRHSLIRRITFDLTGLPPTPEEVAEFLADESPAALSKLIDRLLASPAYGERWGRHWLDVARYSDTSGKDENAAYGHAYRYRDYVIAAFNQDKPFDRFVHEQLAGDLLPARCEAERYEQVIAAGFLQLGPKALAEQDKPKLLMDIVDEQIEVLGQGLLGLSVNCARCHDHKFDPIPTRDYYALAGIFGSTHVMDEMTFVSWWLDVPLADKSTVAKVTAHTEAVRKNKKEIAEYTQDANDAIMRAWRKDTRRYFHVASRLARSDNDQTPSVEKMAAEHRLRADVLERWVKLLSDSQTPGRNIHDLLTPWRAVASLTADQFPGDARKKIESSLENGKPTEVSRYVASWFKELTPRSLDDVAAQYDAMFSAIDQEWTETQEKAKNQAPIVQLGHYAQEKIRQILYGDQGIFRLPNDARDLYPDNVDKHLAKLETEREVLEKEAPPTPPMAISVRDGTIADARIHVRGNHLNLGEAVPRGFLQAVSLADPPHVNPDQSGRLQLAEWLTRPDHPLTSRVLVNRLWLWHFGEGLCRTPDDFGTRGDEPAHQPLLDWLAHRLIENNWSIKAMHRVILLSSTYQMSGTHNDAAMMVDPENRLHGRFERRRLTAEEIRDAILAVSGQLDRTMGGGLLNHKNRVQHVDNKKKVNYDFKRRSVYLPVVRNALYDVFQLFDFGDAQTVNGQRSETTVAPQALFLMNSQMAFVSAQKMSEKLLAMADLDTTERIRHLHRLVFSREPTQSEIELTVQHRNRIAAAIADQPAEPGRQRTRVWETLCQGFLSANEFVFVE